MEDIRCPGEKSEKLDLVVHACHPSHQEAEAGGSRVQGHPWLHSKLEGSLGYSRPCISVCECACVFVCLCVY